MALGAAANCDMPCTGNASEVCGGAVALSVYECTYRYWEAEGEEAPAKGPLCWAACARLQARASCTRPP